MENNLDLIYFDYEEMIEYDYSPDYEIE